jgi:hypothetical protein
MCPFGLNASLSYLGHHAGQAAARADRAEEGTGHRGSQ